MPLVDYFERRLEPGLRRIRQLGLDCIIIIEAPSSISFTRVRVVVVRGSKQAILSSTYIKDNQDVSVASSAPTYHISPPSMIGCQELKTPSPSYGRRLVRPYA